MQHSKTRGGTIGSNTKPRTSGSKTPDHRWQRSPTSEKKHIGRVSELELQLAQLQEELNKTKNELKESELRAKRANHEAEEAQRQLAAMSAKLDESQKQLDELWACEESRIQELRKISQDRDRAWESELKAIQKHLTTAIAENQKLNIRLHKAAECEADHAKKAESAQLQLLESVDIIKQLKFQLNESKDSESRALEQLEIAKLNENTEVGEMESELRRLKVQTEQWRKAAEVAAAMVLGGDGGGGDGKFVDLLNFNVVGEKSNSLCFEDNEDESSIKKTSNMLKKIGVLLKKGQK